MPYTISYPQSGYPLPALENATAGFRPHIHGVHSRTAMPWSSDGSASSRSNSLALHQTAAAPQVSTSYDPGHTGSRTQLLTEPCIPSSSSAGGSGNGNGNNLGYIFPPYTSETSPTSAASQSNVYTPVSGVTSLMMPPTTSGLRYRGSASNLSGPADDTTSTGGGVGGNNPQTPRTGNGASSAHHREAAASLYSFSTETSDRAGSVAPSEVPTSTGGTAVSRGEGVEGGWSGRPQHAASSEGLRRLSGIEGRGGSGNGLGSMGVGVGHRSSARSLNGRH